MRPRPLRQPNRTFQEYLLAAIAMLALLMMPASYRAGAEHPHPHAMLQLWVEASHGVPHHHHHDDRTAAQTTGTVQQHSHEPHHAGSSGLSDVRLQALLHDQPVHPDIPIEPDVSLAIQLQVLAMAPLLLLPLVFAPARRRVSLTTTRLLTGIIPRPEPPPPRNHQVSALI